MSIYEFDDMQSSINIFDHSLPSPWINYLSNGRLHAFVSQAGGGFLWWKDSIVYRITRYRQYNLPIDSPGFYIYIKCKDGSVWSPTFRPCETPLEEWTARHQPGKTTFIARKGELEARFTLFMAMDYDALVWDLSLTNHSAKDIELDLFAYVEFSQFMWRSEIESGYYWRHMLKTWHDAQTDAIVYLFHSNLQPHLEEVPLIYFASTEPVVSYCGDRDMFVGSYRYEKDPASVEKGSCGNIGLTTGEPCGALQNSITIKAGETKKINYFLGIAQGALLEYDDAKDSFARDLDNLRKPEEVDRQLCKVDEWWKGHLDVFKCYIENKDAERQINIWGPLNCVNTARFSRSVNTNAPGVRGVGFRDTCQDMLAIAYRKPEWAEEMLLCLLTKQFEDGHVVHEFHPYENKLPNMTICSDNHLWPSFLVHAIVAETGDLSVIDKKVPFLAVDGVNAASTATVWEHLLASVKFTESHLGVHKLPLTLHGDWNDIIGKFSKEGRGESVFAAQQYVVTLRYLIEIADAIKDTVNAVWLRDCLARQKKAIVDCAWDGKWWLRGFDDYGNPVGSENSEYGKLFLNPQSWAVLSGVGESEQLKMAMNEVNENLDTGLGIKKLTPGFKTWPEVSDPFTGYGPGCGENGAVFCHSNTWAIMAEAILGNGARAWNYYTQIVPHVALQKVGLQVYQAEPYAWVSNIVGPENSRFGWANVTQVTGTASWMDVAATQYLIGVRGEIGGLRIDPCIPESWKSFSVSRLFRGCRVNINVMNPDMKEKGVASIMVDGVRVNNENLPVIPASMLVGKSEAAVEVVMG